MRRTRRCSWSCNCCPAYSSGGGQQTGRRITSALPRWRPRGADHKEELARVISQRAATIWFGSQDAGRSMVRDGSGALRPRRSVDWFRGAGLPADRSISVHPYRETCRHADHALRHIAICELWGSAGRWVAARLRAQTASLFEGAARNSGVVEVCTADESLPGRCRGGERGMQWARRDRRGERPDSLGEM